MQTSLTEIEGVILITPRKFTDDRGFFYESFRQNVFAEAAKSNDVFVQDNHSFSETQYTVRGLHYQSPPFAQGKLVRCTQGRVFDVAVDVRRGSSTYGKYVSAILSAENMTQIYVPPGFLHGFATLEPNCEVQYKCTNYYHPDHDGNIMWNDSDIAIDWGFDNRLAVVSQKDAGAPSFSNFVSPF